MPDQSEQATIVDFADARTAAGRPDLRLIPGRSARPLGLTTSQAAAYLGVSGDTVRRWADKGKLDSYRTPGGMRRFSSEQIAGFLQSCAEPKDSARSPDGELSDSARQSAR